ncbi:uncharacterized protein JCM15063_005807 [Sporobolomyces koalae]|uniref:uncharacterized protein n=1 Tax=Sporobolomyces koalae TaxID=500713 RepID=UPI00317C6972
MSLLRRALRSVGLRIGKDRYLAGTDLEGNSFYEKPHPEFPGEWRKNKRYVEYRVTRYLSDYNFHTIPVQWSSWLRRTRREPPTLPELERDYYRQLRLQENVDKLEIAYQEEKLRLQAKNDEALLLTEGLRMEAGLPDKEVGIGAKEAEIGKHLGVKDHPATAATTTEMESGPVEGKEAEQIANQRREKDREAARKRREEFARNAPPTGNPSDSFQPEASNLKPAARRR